jgi:hypothetical protein
VDCVSPGPEKDSTFRILASHWRLFRPADVYWQASSACMGTIFSHGERAACCMNICYTECQKIAKSYDTGCQKSGYSYVGKHRPQETMYKLSAEMGSDAWGHDFTSWIIHDILWVTKGKEPARLGQCPKPSTSP